MKGLTEAAQLTTFRFPPNTEVQTTYNDHKRDAFKALFEISRSCFISLCAREVLPPPLRTACEAVASDEPPLFSNPDAPEEPFTSPHQFAESFFNLFNYNNGLLNPHFDRSLVTVIKPQMQAGESSILSALWVKSSNDEWTNVDLAVGPDEVIVLLGEDAEQLEFVQRLSLYAAEHAVRVDPKGSYIPHSHFRRDPDTIATGNRISAAFILRHDPVAPVG